MSFKHLQLQFPISQLMTSMLNCNVVDCSFHLRLSSNRLFMEIVTQQKMFAVRNETKKDRERSKMWIAQKNLLTDINERWRQSDGASLSNIIFSLKFMWRNFFLSPRHVEPWSWVLHHEMTFKKHPISLLIPLRRATLFGYMTFHFGNFHVGSECPSSSSSRLAVPKNYSSVVVWLSD